MKKKQNNCNRKNSELDTSPTKVRSVIVLKCLKVNKNNKIICQKNRKFSVNIPLLSEQGRGIGIITSFYTIALRFCAASLSC